MSHDSSPDVKPMVEEPGAPVTEDAPEAPPAQTGKAKKVGRNDPCPCGSGKKYKACCIHLEEDAAVVNAILAKIPQGVTENMPHFINWLLNTGQIRYLGWVKPEAWDLLLLQTLHARCLTDMQMQARQQQEQQASNPEWLAQQREHLAAQLGKLDERLAELAQSEESARPPSPGNTSPAT